MTAIPLYRMSKMKTAHEPSAGVSPFPTQVPQSTKPCLTIIKHGRIQDGSISCPECEYPRISTMESRPAKHAGQTFIRRRKRCDGCGHRWTTYEVPTELFERAIDALKALEEARSALGTK